MNETQRLSQTERDAFAAEMEGNLGGSGDTVEFLLNLIDDVPQARAALREWLENVPENEEGEVA